LAYIRLVSNQKPDFFVLLESMKGLNSVLNFKAVGGTGKHGRSLNVPEI